MGQLPGGKELDFVFKTMAENNDESALTEAMEIINSANDRSLRSEVINALVKWQKGEDSIQQDAIKEDFITFIKRQFGLILIQGFRMGQGYQQKIDNAAFTELLQNATKSYEEKIEEKRGPIIEGE